MMKHYEITGYLSWGFRFQTFPSKSPEEALQVVLDSPLTQTIEVTHFEVFEGKRSLGFWDEDGHKMYRPLYTPVFQVVVRDFGDDSYSECEYTDFMGKLVEDGDEEAINALSVAAASTLYDMLCGLRPDGESETTWVPYKSHHVTEGAICVLPVEVQ